MTGSTYPACRCNACSQGRTDCPVPSACHTHTLIEVEIDAGWLWWTLVALLCVASLGLIMAAAWWVVRALGAA